MSRGFSYLQHLDNVYTEPNTGCWLWAGTTNPTNGYGRAQFRGKREYAHRISYVHHTGEIPDGLEVLHSCDVPLCVNPAHLRVGTHAENMKDVSRRKRCSSATLTDDAVMAIWLDPRPANTIAKSLGIGRMVIRGIKGNKSYLNVRR